MGDGLLGGEKMGKRTASEIRGHKMKVGTETLYRPRGVSIRTGRTNWITAFWYRSRKDALQVVKMVGRDKDFKDIKIVPAPNRQYKGKYILVSRISTMF